MFNKHPKLVQQLWNKHAAAAVDIHPLRWTRHSDTTSKNNQRSASKKLWCHSQWTAKWPPPQMGRNWNLLLNMNQDAAFRFVKAEPYWEEHFRVDFPFKRLSFHLIGGSRYAFFVSKARSLRTVPEGMSAHFKSTRRRSRWHPVKNVLHLLIDGNLRFPLPEEHSFCWKTKPIFS